MKPTDDQSAPMKKYIGYIWIGDQPGIRLNLWARDANEAIAAVEGQYGKGHVFSVWNQEDADRPR
jgi:hypothetical protein